MKVYRHHQLDPPLSALSLFSRLLISDPCRHHRIEQPPAPPLRRARLNLRRERIHRQREARRVQASVRERT